MATATLGVLAYGSCLRGVDPGDTLVDLYVLVSSYRDAHGGRIEAVANRLLPPNVYYLEHLDGARTLRSKYAVVSLDQFCAQGLGHYVQSLFLGTLSPAMRLVYARDDARQGRIHEALATAARTAYANGACWPGRKQTGDRSGPPVLSATYGTELRPESTARAAGIVTDGELAL